jgi:hypothetical protein
MKLVIFLAIFTCSLLQVSYSFSQQIHFNRVIQDNTGSQDPILSFAEDKQGFIWYTTKRNGLHQYNGSQIKIYKNN